MNRRLRLAWALLGFALVGCSSGPPGSGARAGAVTATASPTPSPSPTATAKATAAATLAPVPAGGPALPNCRLPVASSDAPVDGSPAHGSAGHGGFIQFPAGTFAADAASLGSYDRALSRWLPVSRAWVSPDGSRYAYPEYRTGAGPVTGIIHVVDVATGTDHLFNVPAPSTPVAFEPEGVYVASVVPNSGAPPQGLALLDPASGGIRQITAAGTWSVVGAGAAFGVDLDPGVPPPPPGPNAGNRVRRLDLASGAVSPVASYPGGAVGILGLSPAGSPLVSVATVSNYSIQGGGASLFSGNPGSVDPAGPIVADGATVWFSSLAGAIWRWDGNGAAREVAITSLPSVQVAGACR